MKNARIASLLFLLIGTMTPAALQAQTKASAKNITIYQEPG